MFGESIYSEQSHHDFSAATKIPESKCNNVSFMKVEVLPSELRNLLAVSESYICYAVTTKRNLLRLINTITGDKIILRGHEAAVIDLKFSPTDNNMLCSIDRGDSGDSPHVFFWQKEEGNEALNFQSIAKLGLQATFLLPHPSQSHIWLLADARHVGLYSTKSGSMPSAYTALPSHLCISPADGEVSGVSFAADGRAIAVAVTNAQSGLTSLQIWRVGSATGDIANLASKPLTPANHSNAPKVANFLALHFVGRMLVTVEKTDGSSGGTREATISYTVHVFRCDARFEMKQIQTLTVNLPRFKSSLSAAHGSNSQLEVSLCCDGSETAKYLILTSR